MVAWRCAILAGHEGWHAQQALCVACGTAGAGLIGSSVDRRSHRAAAQCRYALLRSMSCDLFLTDACVTVRDPRRSRGVACAPGVVRCVWIRSREPHRLNSVSIAALAGQQRDAGHWRLDHISSGGSAKSAVAAAWRRLGGTRCMLPGCRGCTSQRGRPRYALVNSVRESQ